MKIFKNINNNRIKQFTRIRFRGKQMRARCMTINNCCGRHIMLRVKNGVRSLQQCSSYI